MSEIDRLRVLADDLGSKDGTIATSDVQALRREAAAALVLAARHVLLGEDKLTAAWVKNAHQFLTDALPAEQTKRAS